MASPGVHHPSDDVLRALGAGTLDAAAAKVVSGHLASCPACRSQLNALSRGVPGGQGAGPSPAAPVAAPATVMPAAPDIPAELRELAQYEVLRELGRGGMGIVYLARNKLMAREEVLKVVNRQRLGPDGG